MQKTFFPILGIIMIVAVFWLNSLEKTRENYGIKEDQKKIPQEINESGYIIEQIASGLNTPWSIIFTTKDRILITERNGKLRVIENGKLLENPLHIFTEVSSTGEEGLMGLTHDPEYSENKLIYLSLAYEKDQKMFVKVVSFKDEVTKLTGEKTIIDNIPAARFHAGCRLAFGPDGKLYITTGDATDKNLAQNLNSLAGKILRLNKDGTIPNDNPFSDNPVWSYGHRNPQGIDWHTENHELYSSEHGPSGFDGPGGGDEINRINRGNNYGWPLVSHEKKQEGTIMPLITFTPAEAPASLLIYSGKVFPQFKNNLFFGALRGAGIIRIVLDEENPDKILATEKLKNIKYGRIREITEGPDGYIYFSTSNRDGRGIPATNDDRIFRIKPL